MFFDYVNYWWSNVKITFTKNVHYLTLFDTIQYYSTLFIFLKEVKFVAETNQTLWIGLSNASRILEYSECLKSKLPKSKICRNPNRSGFGIQTVQISDVWAFKTTPQLSEIQTGHPHHNTTFKCYLLITCSFPLWGMGVRT